MSVEWSFGEISRYWAFTDFKKNMKVYKSPVGKLYIIAAFLTNCLACVKGRKTVCCAEGNSRIEVLSKLIVILVIYRVRLSGGGVFPVEQVMAYLFWIYSNGIGKLEQLMEYFGTLSICSKK